MPSTKKKKGGSKALTLKKKGPTEKQKKAVRNAVSQQKKILKDTAKATMDGLTGGLLPKVITKHLPHLKLPHLKLPHFKLPHHLKAPHIKLDPKKLGRKISHDIHKTTHFMTGWFKALTWPHLVERSWKCPPKGKHWDGKEIIKPKLKRPHFKVPHHTHIKVPHRKTSTTLAKSHKKPPSVAPTETGAVTTATPTAVITHKGGRRTRRYIRRKRRTRRKQCRRCKRRTRRKRCRKRRRKTRYRRYKTKKKKSLTASMKQLKAWVGSTEFNKIQKGRR